MQRNLGTVDLVIRAMLGFSLLGFFAKDGNLTEAALPGLLIGVYLLASGIFCFCPLYKAMGISTYGPLDDSI
jgi:hypothetical protein